jgi:porphobilinogen synthase
MTVLFKRLRRLRRYEWSRNMIAEHRLAASDMVLPLFIHDNNKNIPIKQMPGVMRLSLESCVEVAKKARDLGVPAIALFPSIENSLKDEKGSEALNENNLVCRAIKRLKQEVPEIGVIADVALDPYTSHGQDGIIDSSGYVLNDISVDQLSKQALVLAGAGADVVAPSDMMDGRIFAIREALEEHGHNDVMILSYAAKYASSFYGPFRHAVGSGDSLGKADKKSYQMDPANAQEAFEEALLDSEEGADMLMVKPGMPYLDVIRDLSSNINLPVLAYQVSGEYAMIKFADAAGAIDGDKAMLEALLAFKRAGARAIFTYAALEIAEQLQKDKL